MKKTAVEYIQEKLQGYGFDFGYVIEQAKEMEKQQMKDASCPYVGGWEDDDFEYWYNQTYKSEQ